MSFHWYWHYKHISMDRMEDGSYSVFSGGGGDGSLFIYFFQWIQSYWNWHKSLLSCKCLYWGVKRGTQACWGWIGLTKPIDLNGGVSQQWLKLVMLFPSSQIHGNKRLQPKCQKLSLTGHYNSIHGWNAVWGEGAFHFKTKMVNNVKHITRFCKLYLNCKLY